MNTPSTRTRKPGSDPEASQATRLTALVDTRAAVVGVIGLGYIGLPVAEAMVGAGFPVLGFDIDAQKAQRLQEGVCDLEHLGEDFVRRMRESDRFQATSDMTRLAGVDVLVVCVPTPLGPGDRPDLGDVERTMRTIAGVLRPGQLVVLESTTYPRTTRDVVRPILDESGLACGSDYFLAYAPEREDPGRTDDRSAIPRLVGALDDRSRDIAVRFYASAVEQVVPVSSAEVAESAKLLENIYRAVNIAMVNEMKTVLTAMDIDIHEVVDAAATKPFGFQAFRPGPGLGGHCIPIDPFYLAHAARLAGTHSKFIELAGEVNRSMPQYVVQRLEQALVERGSQLEGGRVLVIGLAYKRDVNDVRGSPGFALLERLWERGVEAAYHDPHVSEAKVSADRPVLESMSLEPSVLAGFDAVIIATDHACLDYPMILGAARLVVDTRGVTRGLDGGDVVVA